MCGVIWGRGQHWEAAEIALQEWSQQQPEAWLPLVLRIRPLGEQGKLDEAGNVWRLAAEKINRETMNAWAQLDLGVLERILNATVNSRAPLKDLDPNSNQVKLFMWYHEQLQTGEGEATLAQIQYRWAQVLEENQDFDEAVRTIEQAVALDSDSVDIHAYRAHLALFIWCSERRLQPDRQLGDDRNLQRGSTPPAISPSSN